MQARPTKSFSNHWRICILVAFLFLLRRGGEQTNHLDLCDVLFRELTVEENAARRVSHWDFHNTEVQMVGPLAACTSM
jgi:hypothetical protein